MNEKQVIKKLSVLKNVQPNNKLLKNIKDDVYQQIRLERRGEVTQKTFAANIHASLSYYRYAVSALAVAFVLFVGMIIFFPNHIHTAVLTGKLTVASNQYEKARIAFADTNKRYGNYQAVNTSNIKDASYSLALTNKEMSHLHLKGENGKYSAQQCQDLYKQYLSFLKKEYAAMQNENNPSVVSLKMQTKKYIEQAETKLNMYHNL